MIRGLCRCLHSSKQKKTYPTFTISPTRNVTRNITKPGHLYLIKEREFIKTNEPIFKIGKTTNIKNRMPSYPKNSLLYMTYYCHWDIDKVEKEIITTFDSLFVKRTDIGNEYYETSDELQLIHAFTKIMIEFGI